MMNLILAIVIVLMASQLHAKEAVSMDVQMTKEPAVKSGARFIHPHHYVKHPHLRPPVDKSQ
jgi:hypothetical protein